MSVRSLLIAAAALALSACGIFAPPSMTPGESESAIIARMGKPTAIYQDGANRLLEYRTNPGGKETWMYRIDSSGRAVGLALVLTVEKFASIRVGQDRQQDVLRKVGAPYDKSYLNLSDHDVWSYMYLENGVWDSLMHVHFDRSGVGRLRLNAIDESRRPVAATADGGP